MNEPASISPAGKAPYRNSKQTSNHPVVTPKFILLAWFGQTDLNAAGGDPGSG